MDVRVLLLQRHQHALEKTSQVGHVVYVLSQGKRLMVSKWAGVVMVRLASPRPCLQPCLRSLHTVIRDLIAQDEIILMGSPW